MHEFDKCIVASQSGTKLAEGFVHSFESTVMKVCLDGESGFYLLQEVTIYVFNRVKGECVYKGVVADADGKNVAFSKVDFVRSTQKRDNTRVGKTLHYSITDRFSDKKSGKLEKLEKPIAITILNISANGMYISCDEVFTVGHRFPLVFKDAGKPICLDVEVIRCERKRRGNNYGCRFLNISEKEADNIFRFVLHEQIEQRRNNLLF
jgi:hypothetical protein